MSKIFFSGIGGSGVSAIASFMADKGHQIAGSDRSFDSNPAHPVYRLLKSKNITIVPQDGRGLDSSFDLAVFSTAVEDDQPEVLKARSIGIPTQTRPEYLARLITGFKTIAVAGTSGKSTTAGMLAFLMQRLGMRPNFIGGGRVKQFRTDHNAGNAITGDSDILVIEACESDGTIVNYKPERSIILNLELDHHSVEKTAAMFETLGENTSGMIILNSDDANLRKVPLRNAVPFSVDSLSRYRAEAVDLQPFSTLFSLNGTRFRLSIPGKYNLYNALSCIALLSQMGIPHKDIAGALSEFSGIERRFDIHLHDRKHLVIDDYAHNPHKLTSFMRTIRKVCERMCYIFQPHGFAPTRMMKTEYIRAFAENLRSGDHLILLPIYYAGGTVSKDITSNDLAVGVRACGKSVEAVESREIVLGRCGEWDNYAILGARDETLADFAGDIADKLRQS
ncbi:MAG: Mur ligase domain-containing protein [Dissulfurispiraceae bacterium]